MTNAERLQKLVEARALILEVRKDVSEDEEVCPITLNEFVNTSRSLKQVIDKLVIIRSKETAAGMGVEL